MSKRKFQPIYHFCKKQGRWFRARRPREQPGVRIVCEVCGAKFKNMAKHKTPSRSEEVPIQHQHGAARTKGEPRFLRPPKKGG